MVVLIVIAGQWFWQFGRGDHGRLGYGRKMTTGQPMEVPINILPPKNAGKDAAEKRWIAKLVACGGRHTLAIVEWETDESKHTDTDIPIV